MNEQITPGNLTFWSAIICSQVWAAADGWFATVVGFGWIALALLVLYRGATEARKPKDPPAP
jgi:hypothetical protein